MSLTRPAQGNTRTGNVRNGTIHSTRDSTPRSTPRLTPVSEGVAPLGPRSVSSENSPDDRATNRLVVDKFLVLLSLCFYSDIAVFHSDVRRLLREQKRLQETSSRIQTMLVDMQKDTTSTAPQKHRVPRDLSVSISINYDTNLTENKCQ